MNTHFRDLMSRAAELTRAGDLRGAATTLRIALAGGSATEPSAGRSTFVPPALPTMPTPMSQTTLPLAPAAERFVGGEHGSAAGRRAFKLFVPPQAGTRPLPLVVMLHGCTQDPDDFAKGTTMNDEARRTGFFVLYPAQSVQANPQRCWNWFKHNHQQRGRGEPALLASMTREVIGRHGIDPRRVFVAGLSAGGAMAAILGETYPDLFAAVGVHSGLAAGAANDLPSALAAMKAGGGTQPGEPGPPTIVFHGDADITVHPQNAHHVAAASAGAAARAERANPPGDGRHGVTRHVYRDASGRVHAEHWLVHGAAHAWSGGSPRGSFTEPRGPAASAEMLRFFLEHAADCAH